MTINEAIENLRLLHSSPLLYETENYRDAVRIAIESLKRIQHLRGYSMTQVDTRLITETDA